MAIGRISGPMLKANLERLGTDLAFETDLLYLDVTNGRIGIKNASPTVALDVTGSAKISSDLTVTGLSDLGNIRLGNNTISATVLDSNLILEANGTGTIELDSDVSVSGNLTLSGTAYLNSTNTYFVDRVIDIGTDTSGASLTIDDFKDRGLALHYFSGSDKKGFLGQVASDKKLY